MAGQSRGHGLILFDDLIFVWILNFDEKLAYKREIYSLLTRVVFFTNRVETMHHFSRSLNKAKQTICWTY